MGKKYKRNLIHFFSSLKVHYFLAVFVGDINQIDLLRKKLKGIVFNFQDIDIQNAPQSQIHRCSFLANLTSCKCYLFRNGIDKYINIIIHIFFFLCFKSFRNGLI